MKNRDKEIYNDRICKYWDNCNSCNKNKFTVYTINDKTVMRCSSYSFTRPELNFHLSEDEEDIIY